MEIVPGIHQIRLPLQIPNSPLDFVSAYLLRGRSGWTLIDTGWNTPGSFDALQAELRAIGVDFKDIELIVITHIHSDHFGLAGKLKTLSGAVIAMHSIENGLIDSRYRNMEPLIKQMGDWLRSQGVPRDQSARLERASMGILHLVIPTDPDRILSDGEVVSNGRFDLEVMLTPGHSPGHICLYERSQKILFSGDQILLKTYPSVGFHLQSGQDPLGEYLRSLDRIRRLEISLTLPAHEEIIPDVRRRIDELSRFHAERSAAILSRVDRKPRTAFEITPEVPWRLDIGGLPWEKMTWGDRRLALMEALAHLEVLRLADKVNVVRQNGRFLYCRA